MSLPRLPAPFRVRGATSLLFTLALAARPAIAAEEPDRAAAERELTLAYCEYQLAFVQLTYEVSDDTLERAMNTARQKVERYVRAHARAKAVGVSPLFELACDWRQGYGDFRGLTPKHLSRHYDRPFKVLRLGALRPANPVRWLAAYRQTHDLEQRMFFGGVERPLERARKRLEEDLYTFLLCGLKQAQQSPERGRIEYAVSGYFRLIGTLRYARNAGLDERTRLSCDVACGPDTCTGAKLLSLGAARRQVDEWQKQVRTLVARLEVEDHARWAAHMQRLTGDRLVTFRNICLPKTTCRISGNDGTPLETPEQLAKATVWITEEPLYHYLYKAYLFQGDRKVDELSTEYAPVRPAGSWNKLRQSAQRFPIRRRSPISAE